MSGDFAPPPDVGDVAGLPHTEIDALFHGPPWTPREEFVGDVEPSLHTFFTDQEHIVRWSIKTRNTYREGVPALASSHPHLVIVRLRSAAEVERWLAGPLCDSVTG
ncbi:hypothetical protein BHE97_03085 [Aeromicrobium sp. PE09-221]|uniref:hypothetical protein n=1 Tax=Aeromicrobium sp. PE09-221 TaxID=1898043 RepID=UPI000B3E597F|nr:hypothetical protein [Aeromicrobium sp. PE09-221]OUZ12188.1 hypothetical protein BHE97_03085 [Aeromicrobium sp. PE09-221]